MSKAKEWDADRAKLKIIYEEAGITACEVMLPGCWHHNALSFAHRKKRREYYGTDDLGKFEETLLACIPCHQKLEISKELTEYYFNKLR